MLKRSICFVPGLVPRTSCFWDCPWDTFPLHILLPKQFTCFQVVRVLARCSLVKKKGSLSFLYQAWAAWRKKAVNPNGGQASLKVFWSCSVKMAGTRILRGNSKKEISSKNDSKWGTMQKAKMWRTGTRIQWEQRNMARIATWRRVKQGREK